MCTISSDESRDRVLTWSTVKQRLPGSSPVLSGLLFLGLFSFSRCLGLDCCALLFQFLANLLLFLLLPFPLFGLGSFRFLVRLLVQLLSLLRCHRRPVRGATDAPGGVWNDGEGVLLRRHCAGDPLEGIVEWDDVGADRQVGKRATIKPGIVWCSRSFDLAGQSTPTGRGYAWKLWNGG